MKECTQCGYSKDETEFYKQSANRDGLTTACRVCVKLAKKTSKDPHERPHIEGSKFCTSCQTYHPYAEFYRNPSTTDGFATSCKRSALRVRRARNVAPALRTKPTIRSKAYESFRTVWNNCKKIHRVPGWADQDAIHEVYRARAERGAGFDVDHIVPLRGYNVCGLHVHYNLRIISSTENKIKGRAFDG